MNCIFQPLAQDLSCTSSETLEWEASNVRAGSLMHECNIASNLYCIIIYYLKLLSLLRQSTA